MGQPSHEKCVRIPPLCGGRVTPGTEISKYREEKKSNEIPLVSDERTGMSLNPDFIRGLQDLNISDFLIEECFGKSNQRE